MNRLYMIKGPLQGHAFDLKDPVTMIGRSPDNDIQLDDPSVSRKHAKIFVKDAKFFVEDLNSQNGTLINGHPATPFEDLELRQGLSIALGNILFILGQKNPAMESFSQSPIDLSRQGDEDKASHPHDQTVITDKKSLELINAFSATLMRSLDIRQICEKIVQALFSLNSRIDAVFILLVDRKSGELKEAVARAKGGMKHPSVTYVQAVVDHVHREGKAVMIADTARKIDREFPEGIEMGSVRSIMCVPLLSHAVVTGAVYAHSVDVPQAFRKEDLSLFSALSGPAAVAIGNALLYDETRQAEGELRKTCDDLEKRVGQSARELLLANKRLAKEIVERKRLGEALKLSDERYRDLIENANDLIQTTDTDGRMRYVNRAWRMGLGYRKEEISGLSVFDVIAPESRPACREVFQRVQSEKRPGQMEALFMTKEGTPVMLEGSVNCRFSGGKPTAIQAILRDVTKRKRAEEALALAREQEVEIGSRIQKTLLLGTAPTNVPGLTVSAMTIPSQRIDGDFYDFFRQSDQCLDILIGDVMGKGVPAALLSAAIKGHFLKALSELIPVSKTFPDPPEIVMAVHNKMVRELIELESFATLCYVRFDLVRRRGALIDCGHTRTIQFQRNTRVCNTLKGYNMPLGFSEEETYAPLYFPLEAGDVLLFYSDGVTEARNPAGEFFGEERLLDCVSSNSHLTPEALNAQVRGAVMDFSETGLFSDDLTCVAVKILEESNLTPLIHLELEMPSDTAQLAKLRDFVQDLCQRNIYPPLDMDNTWQLGLAANEAAANIMRHAYDGLKYGKIHIVAEAFVDRIVLCLNHWGKPFEPPESIEPPQGEMLPESGYGLFVIQSYVDDVRYASDREGKRSIVLVKNRTRS
ncbi:MAG: SpoIIE family protein phosphatase [Desulfatiglandales bacterium]